MNTKRLTSKRLRAWRAELGWNQTKAARYLGTNPENISRWEADKKPIPEHMAILAHLLRYKVNILRVEDFLTTPLDTE